MKAKTRNISFTISNQSDKVIEQAKSYYNSSDADNFYFHIWGGEDIHVGWYESDTEDIFTASRRTVEKMSSKLARHSAGTNMLDIGAGYGGSARLLAKNSGCHVTCLNLSEVQNERNRATNADQNLRHLIDVVDGSFENLPFEENSFDVVWSQDALLHSGEGMKVFQEVDRCLRSDGDFIFTDPMQRRDVSPELLQPVLNRIHLLSMGSIETYVAYARGLGWKTVEIEESTDKLMMHYTRVLEELQNRQDEMAQYCSTDYIERMKQGLACWIDASKKNALSWGILHFRKP